MENTNFTLNDLFPDLRLVTGLDYLSDLPKYFSQLTSNPHNIHSLGDMKAFTQFSPPEQYPQRDTGIWDDILESLGQYGLDNTSPLFWPAYQRLLAYSGPEGVTRALHAHNLDALILPSDFSVNMPALAGLPVVNVPMGSYPSSSPVTITPPWNLINTAPNIP